MIKYLPTPSTVSLPFLCIDIGNIWLHDQIQSTISGYYNWDEAETE